MQTIQVILQMLFPFTTFKPSAYIDGIPVSKNFYDTFEENDLRRQNSSTIATSM